MIPTIAFTILLLLTVMLLLALPTAIHKAKGWMRIQPVPKGRKRTHAKPPANWHKSSHRSKKQQHKAYVAPVIKRKWRTPRRSSH